VDDQSSFYVSFGLDDPITPTARDEDADPIVIAVTIVGALITISALLGLLGSVNLSFGRHADGSTIGALFDLAYLALGIGLIFRREQARQVYVVLAVISLIFLAIGAVGVVTASGRSSVSNNSARYLEQRIAVIESNPHISEAARKRGSEQLRERVADTPGVQTSGASNGDIGDVIPGLLITLVPLVFFTHQRVRRVFQ
jgi:hypothetical protein